VPLDQDIVDGIVRAVARRQSVADRSCVVAQSVWLAHARRNIDRHRRVRVDQMSVGIFDQSRRPGRTHQDHSAVADRRQPHGVRFANDRFSVPAIRNRSRPARLRSTGRRRRSPGPVRRGRPSNTSHGPGRLGGRLDPAAIFPELVEPRQDHSAAYSAVTGWRPVRYPARRARPTVD